MTSRPPPPPPQSTWLPGSLPEDNLVLQDWPLHAGGPIRGQVLLVHGLGEHIGNYTELANQLNHWGFAVRGYDQYGHGESSGERGDVPDEDRLMRDLATVIDDTRAVMDDRLPLILLGQGMGALVAARLVSRKLRRVEGLVMSSPALSVCSRIAQAPLLRAMALVAAHWPIESRAIAEDMTHDLQAIEAWRKDRLRHECLTARLAHFIVKHGEEVLARAPRWKLPTLLLYAGRDKLVFSVGSERFARLTPADVVQAHHFPMHFHALLHELDRQPVYEAMRQWLCARHPQIMLNQAPVRP